MNLQTIVSRRLSPTDIGVVSVTELITDGTRNALPGLARILGDARSFQPEVSAEIEKQMRIIAEGTARTYNVAAEVSYTREFVPLVNDAALVDEAVAAARTAVRARQRLDCRRADDRLRGLRPLSRTRARLLRLPRQRQGLRAAAQPGLRLQRRRPALRRRFHAAIVRQRLSST